MGKVGILNFNSRFRENFYEFLIINFFDFFSSLG